MGHLQFCPDSNELVKAVRELCGRFGPNKIDEIFLMKTINYAFQTSSEILSSPARRINEILALPHLADDFKGQIRDKRRWNFMI
ncbi:Hypothetical predicted protein [Olea europaea subsp. europaea]|uniref:Uncharacterized protein n=1 Tax=Olea europaea subsp. europaea TaxID=158383 RepID=A0A8S0SQD6_OLEEU|nr:Hypothetical predicted protein [Olea europaea subsp. europaea]